MQIITIDLETFWSQTHTLTKMNPIEYVLHPETELISLAMKVGTNPTLVAFGEDNIRAMVNSVNWSDAWVVGHNLSAFDSMILSWRLGVRPKMWGCTLAMARPIHAKTTGLSLAKLVEHYALGVKDNTALVNTRGKKLADFTMAERQAMAEYNKADTDQCFELFKILRRHYSPAELWHLDSKIRGIVEPMLQVDEPLLEDALARERANKRQSLLALGQMFREQVMPVGDIDTADEEYLIERVRATLASAPMFSKVLEARGVPVPMKPSPTNPANFVPALAKTDQEFQDLQNHEDELVAAAAAARLAVKSTMAETRMQAFLDVARQLNGKWPVTVHYCGADTTGRASGWMYNPLNLPRVNPKKPRITDALRMSLVAPPGYKVVVADLSGIEMRVNHFLWQVPYSTQLWRDDANADLYRASYAMKLGIASHEVTDEQRQASKVENLALGFGMGPAKYVGTARIMGGMTITAEQAEMDVADWRRRHEEIVRGWRTCHTALSWIAEGMERPIDPTGLVWTCAEGIKLPSGRIIRYPELRREDDEWVYGLGRHRSRIYAGKVTENIVQALARDVVYDVALDVFRLTGYRPALEVYDELVYVVPEDKAEDHLAIVQDRMRQPPPWFPELVTWSEGDIADRYGSAK